MNFYDLLVSILFFSLGNWINSFWEAEHTDD